MVVRVRDGRTYESSKDRQTVRTVEAEQFIVRDESGKSVLSRALGTLAPSTYSTRRVAGKTFGQKFVDMTFKNPLT